jgi:hypothetical protein
LFLPEGKLFTSYSQHLCKSDSAGINCNQSQVKVPGVYNGGTASPPDTSLSLFTVNYALTDSTIIPVVQHGIGFSTGCLTLSDDSRDMDELQIDLFPNPSGSFIRIISREGDVEFQLYDLNGRIVLSGNTNDNVIDISKINSGVYIVRFRMDDRYLFKRIVRS